VALSHRVRISLWVVGSIVTVLAATVAAIVVRFQPVARDYVISALKQRYKSDVSLGNLQISLFPEVHVRGENLVLRLAGAADRQPMISIRRFTVDARFVGFFRSPKRIRKLTLEGLEIHIPPKRQVGHQAAVQGTAEAPFILEEVAADGTALEILPADPQKLPLTFDIQQLTLHSVGPGQPMTFHAVLENPKPPGLIHSDGQFGPWNEDEPGDTGVSGKYTFRDADLSVFHGINGILSSDGTYQGQLSRIDVHGTTEVPRFSLSLGGTELPLHTEFDATVDGTNGNTDLHPVRALLGKSAFEVSGAIERRALETHKEIDLKAHTKETGLQDFLRLAIKGAPPMKGRIGFDTNVQIPPGTTPVIRRLRLAGMFTLNGVRFTSASVQQKIASLSHHAQGDPKNTDVNEVAAAFRGQFTLGNGVLALPKLTFEVPGAEVDLAGQYALESGAIDFRGNAKLEATVSHMTTGVKSLLLRPLDPLFRHDGAGTELPVEISGTRGSPSFRLNLGQALRRRKQQQ
jgi:AsmA-like C-terminal region